MYRITLSETCVRHQLAFICDMVVNYSTNIFVKAHNVGRKTESVIPLSARIKSQSPRVTAAASITVKIRNNAKRDHTPTLTSQVAAKYLMNKCGFLAMLVKTEMQKHDRLYESHVHILPCASLKEPNQTELINRHRAQG